jgi:type I restriction enzyme S subunit
MKWQDKRFDEIGTIERGRSRHRPRNDESLYGGNYPFIQTGDVKAANLYIYDYSQTYNEKGLEQSHLWERGTLCITIAANIAETSILGIEACFPDSIIGFRSFEGESDVRFIKYFFDIWKKRIQMVSQGATQDNLSLEKLLKFKVPCPPIETQRRIASILSAYDDLIENNLKRIKLLEEAAQNIYREWFVNFRFPGWETAKFGNDGLPEGWEMKSLCDVLEIKNGRSYIEDDNPKIYNIFGSNGIIGKASRFNRSDAVIIGRVGAYCGSLKYSKKSFWATDNTITIESITDRFSILLALYSLKELNLERYAGGAAQPLLTQKTISRLNVKCPEVAIASSFRKLIGYLYSQIEILGDQVQLLSEARDILLPRLMNQTIEV